MLCMSMFESLLKRPYLTSLILFFVSFLSRLSAINRYITPDELIWVFRSIQFSEALRAGQWANTITSGHPGVTITWLGTAAIQLQLLVQPESQAAYEWITKVAWLTPDNIEALRMLAQFLTAGRLAVVLVQAAGIVTIFWLVQRLVSVEGAGLTAVFLIFDPFTAGLSSLLHVDATMTLFATLALLLLALIMKEPAKQTKKRFVGFCAFFTAVSLLTKSPAILLVGVCLLFLLMKGLVDPSVAGRRGGWIFKQTAVWLLIFVVSVVALLPAVWSSFSTVVDVISGDANQHIGDALRPTFFMGQVQLEHGPLFYPISVLFRLSPPVFLGIFLSIGLMASWLWRHVDLQSKRFWQALLLHPTAVFLLWIVGFVGGITLAAKKFDRYALPIIPLLILLSAWGWMSVGNGLLKKRPYPLILSILAILNFLFFWPYPLAAYNFLLGGPQVAQNVMTVGWGEPVSAGARWLVEHEETADKIAVGAIPQALAPFYSGPALPSTAEYSEQADYIIWSQNERQLTGFESPPVDDLLLLKTISYGGMPQTWLFENRSPDLRGASVPLWQMPVLIDGRFAIKGSDLQVRSDQLQLLLVWERLRAFENGRYQVRLTLLDENGNVWSETERPLVNHTYFYPQDWQQPQTSVRYQIDLEPAMPPASYTLNISLIEEQSGATLPLFGEDNTLLGVTFPIETVEWPHTPLTNQTILPIEQPIEADVGPDLRLLGMDTLPKQMASGAPLPLHLYWRAEDEMTEQYQLQFTLGSEQIVVPLSRFSTDQWQQGEIIHERYGMSAPIEGSLGLQPLSITLLGSNGTAVPNSTIHLGEIEIVGLDRLFRLPENIQYQSNYRLDNVVLLRGVDVSDTAVSPNTTLNVTLYWEVIEPPSRLVSAFVHLIQENGSNVVQSDQWPGGLPSDLWTKGQIIVDQHQIELPAELPNSIRLAVGLYTADDGVRLTAVDASQNLIPDNRIILPIPLQVEQP